MRRARRSGSVSPSTREWSRPCYEPGGSWRNLPLIRAYADYFEVSLKADDGMSYLTSMYCIVNKDKWKALSPADQKAIKKINDDYNKIFGKKWVELDNNAMAFAKGKGVTFLPVSKEEETATAQKMKPILDEYVKMAKSKSLPGDEALKFCQDFLKSNP